MAQQNEAAWPNRDDPHVPQRGRLLLATSGVFLAISLIVAATAGDLGLTWDEVPYRHSQLDMARWFSKLKESQTPEEAKRVLSKEVILTDWVYNRYGPNFHPPMAGMLCNLTHALFGGIMDDLAARRVASGMELALAAAALFHFLARRSSCWVGGVAALSLVLMPRVFGHAHIAGTDMPLMTFWALVVMAFWNGLDSRAWRVLFGILLGLAFLVKFTAVLLIVPLVVWLVIGRGLAGWTARSVWVAIGSTVFVAWPVALAGLEIIRLDPLIRRTAQQRALQIVLNSISDGATLEQMIGHEGPFQDRELQKAAAQITLRLRKPLDLDNYIQYVHVTDLGVQPWLGGWILFLPPALWMLWSILCWLGGWQATKGAGLRLWLAGLALAPAVAVACNPTWWHDTLPQFAHYFQIAVGRQAALPDIEIFYLGKKYLYSLPWHNGWVLALVTVPTVFLALGMVGTATAIRYCRQDPVRMLFLLNMITLPIVRMLPTPAHDGVRLMLPTFFFLAGMVGWGFQLIERLVERWRVEEYSTTPILSIIASFILVPPTYWLIRTHPYHLSYYNGLVGGLPGAQRLGFEPTYWYDAVTPEVLEEMNDTLPHAAVLNLPDRNINVEVFWDLKNLKKLRSDIEFDRSKTREFPFVPLLTHSSKATPFTRLMYALEPQASWGTHDGVRLFSLYGPDQVARAWALWLFLDASSYAGTRVVEPRANHELIRLARQNYRALYAAAVRIAEDGVEQTLESDEDSDTMSVVRHLAGRKTDLEQLLARRKQALVEAAEIINEHSAERPDLLVQLIEYEGYLPDAKLGEFLDTNHNLQ